MIMNDQGDNSKAVEEMSEDQKREAGRKGGKSESKDIRSENSPDRDAVEGSEDSQ